MNSIVLLPNELRIDAAEREKDRGKLHSAAASQAVWDLGPNALKPNEQIINTRHGQVNARGDALAPIRWDKEKAPTLFAWLGTFLS
jgi:hypothetical protein